jgi:hypothetical protein
MGRACSSHGRDEKAYKILVGKLEERRPFLRPVHRWENSIKVVLKEIVCGVDSSGL